MAIAHLPDFLLLSLVRIVTRMPNPNPRAGISKDVDGDGEETFRRMKPEPLEHQMCVDRGDLI